MATPIIPVPGVIADGTAPSFTGPSTTIEIPRQSTAIIRLIATLQNGQPLDLVGAVGILTLRAKNKDTLPRVARSAIGIAGSNTMDFPISPSETDQPEYALVYDIILTFSTGDRAQASWQGDWIPQPNVAQLADTLTIIPPAIPALLALPSTVGHEGDFMRVVQGLPQWSLGSGGTALQRGYRLNFLATDIALPISLILDFGAEGIVGKKYSKILQSGLDAQGYPASRLGWDPTSVTDTGFLVSTGGGYEGPVDVIVTQFATGLAGTVAMSASDILSSDGRNGVRVLFVDDVGTPILVPLPYQAFVSTSVDKNDLVSASVLPVRNKLNDGFEVINIDGLEVDFDWMLPMPAIGAGGGGSGGGDPWLQLDPPTSVHQALFAQGVGLRPAYRDITANDLPSVSGVYLSPVQPPFNAFGDAILDGSNTGTDDQAAFQAMFTQLEIAGGGVALVPGFSPDGTPRAFRLRQSMTFNPSASPNYYELDGRGSRIWWDPTVDSLDAFTISNISGGLRFRGISFFGWNGDIDGSGIPLASFPPHTTRSLINSGTVLLFFEDVKFKVFQLNGDTTAGLITGSALWFKRVQWESCGSGNVLLAKDWTDFHMEDCMFTDFTTLRGFSGALSVSAAIVIGQPAVSTEQSVYGAAQCSFVRTRFDEGSGQINIGEPYTSDVGQNFVVPVVGANVTVLVGGNGSYWMRVNDMLLFGKGVGYYQVQSVPDSSHVVVKNTGRDVGGGANLAAGQTVVAGLTIPITGSYIGSVNFTECQMNVEPFVNSAGIFVAHARHVYIKNCWFREGNTGSVVLRARDCNVVTIEGSTTRYDDGGALRAVDIDASVDLAYLIDTDIDESTCHAKQTIVIKNGVRSPAQFTTAGRPAASSVRQGVSVWDSTLSKLVYSDGTNWRRVSDDVIV